MAQTPWFVHKFGGTSLASAERYQGVGEILESAEHAEPRKAVVVSAMAGVTNTLLGLVELAGARDESYRAQLEALAQKQIDTINALVEGDEARKLVAELESDVADIEDILHALWLLRGQSQGAQDLIPGYGELWSARVLAAYLGTRSSSPEQVAWLDARQVIVVAPGELGPVVDWARTNTNLQGWLAERGQVELVVVTGFIASTPAGIPTTLGRNGSDFSAAIMAACLDAQALSIWTDVDGVMSANPRQVPEAQVLDELSYHEAMELAYFGAKVIHPGTMAPVVAQNIPIYIRNTFAPQVPGTRIHLEGSAESIVKGFATIDEMALFNVEGTGMIGVPGIAHRLFGALRDADVSVVMISQGSSEHSICFAIPSAQVETAKTSVKRAFYAELDQGQIQTIDVATPCSILAVVGDGMAGIPGVAAKFFGALGKADVNIRAIAQGSSERNISAVIDQKDVTRALRAVHAGFYLSNLTISIGIIGPGNVGATLLSQIRDQAARLEAEFKIDLRVRGITTSSRMLLDERALDLAAWQDEIEGAGLPAELDAFIDHVHADYLPHAVLIDCTSSTEISAGYSDWLREGIHVITPNKKANTRELAYYRELQKQSRSMRSHYLYETTVGAGLPIIQTLRDLIQTGDEIFSIEGIFSGTLSYLFNSYDGTKPFSQILSEAKDMGYTEPDPRDDLSGMDVARKLVILAREMGLTLELGDIDVESLVPGALESASVENFMSELPGHDDAMLKRLEEARRSGNVLRFVGAVNRDGQASVRLQQYPLTHAFGRIQLTDNIVQFRTRRYDDNPLIVQGPGAGPDVTAGGIFADLLRLAAYLGATR